MSYDAWLERPYQQRAEQEEASRCPECDEHTLEYEDDGVRCTNDDCSYAAYRDYDRERGGADDDDRMERYQ